ncbi:MAG: homogentisate 1,2-dioxygenase [Acidobacteriota bacterium]|nr:homogentisate 1,2-dioxygenase [Acidobacteriota bacterium]
MPIYHRLGKIPRKRHAIFRQPDGSLYPEQLMGNKGFVGISSLLYHLRPPTQVKKVETLKSVALEKAGDPPLRHRHFRGHRLDLGGSAVLDRVPLMFNRDLASYLVAPDREDDFFYRNSQGDEVVYVAEGEGVLESQFGDLPFQPGDYLVIPRNITHRYRYAEGAVRLLILESAGYIRVPKRYRNEHGQLTEDSPFSERDLRLPQELQVHDETGEFQVVVKQYDSLTSMTLAHHPFDVVGWDGYYYPWALNIHDFEPRVGRFHLPPPIHQTFEGDGFVICSFCPRPYDFDPEAVPAPYNHSNVMSDEVLYYASSEFMSRKGIEYGSLTLHPDGLPHGPHPGRAEASIGQKGTDELAVMFDTFRPLHVAKPLLAVEDETYVTSWLE